MSRESLRLHATSILDLIAWGEAAEQANAGLVAERDAALRQASAADSEIQVMQGEINGLESLVAEKDATIAALDEQLKAYGIALDAELRRVAALNDEIERLKAELALRPDRDMFTAWWTQDKP